MAGVTLAAAVPATLVRLFTFGAVRPSGWIGARACRVWARALCALLSVRIRVRGALPRGTFLVAANHVSYLDIMVLGSLYPSVFVAKLEIASWPLFGWTARGAGTLFVDRERARDVARVGELMRRYLAAGIPLTLFPEGRSSRGDTIHPFLPSLLEPAAREEVPCYAATLHYETPGEPAPPSETVSWWGGVGFLPHLFRLMGLPEVVATVTFTERPIRSTDRKLLARRLREAALGNFTPIRQEPISAPCAP
jgi:1-acyl-sn-glycerol-3-phosphate acyltransferase